MQRRLLTNALIAILLMSNFALAEDTGKTNAIVFPATRNFQHPFEILTKPDGEITILRMLSKADDNRILCMVEFQVKDFAAKGKSPSVLDAGSFIFFSEDNELANLNPKEIIFVIDGKELKLKCERDNKILIGYFALDKFPLFLSSKQVRVKISNVEFDLEDLHIEAMRDLASRLPDGKSSFGKYIISHKPDGREANLPKNDRLQTIMADVKKTRLVELAENVKKIASAKTELKQATITGDEIAIGKITESLTTYQQKIQSLIDQPLATKSLDPRAFREGEYGKISQFGLKVLQVNDKKAGKALIYHPTNNRINTFRVIGMDLRNTVDDSDFPQGHSFAVLGTTTYETVAGGTKTIFELQEIQNNTVFSEMDFKPSMDAMKSAFDIELTKDEQIKADAAKEANTKRQKAKKAENDAKQMQKDIEAKFRRAQSYLDSGKILMKKENNAGARKQFEKAVAESPDSKVGKEAQELIDRLPR